MEEKKWIKVRCHKCGTEEIIFGRASSQVVCTKEGCDEILAIPTGGKASVKAEILELL